MRSSASAPEGRRRRSGPGRSASGGGGRPWSHPWATANALGSIGARYRRKKLVAPTPLPPLPLSPSWAASAPSGSSIYAAGAALAASVASRPPRSFLAEGDAAATLIQRALRGRSARARLWDRGGGVLVAWSAVKIQRRWRGTRGRLVGHRAFVAKIAAAASRIQALRAGFLARRVAREMRVAIAEAAALKVQTAYRGRLGAKFFVKWREMRRTESIERIQRAWRGARPAPRGGGRGNAGRIRPGAGGRAGSPPRARPRTRAPAQATSAGPRRGRCARPPLAPRRASRS